MLWRLTLFLLCLVVPAIAGGWVAGANGAFAGWVVGSLCWFSIDLVRGAGVLRWLRFASPSDMPRLGGLWGEIVDRARRAMRAREQQALDAEQRLQELLAAIQASPNGVVLLGPDGRIEWCNLTAQHHLGIDPQRDMQQLVGNLLRDPQFTAYYSSGDYRQDVVIAGRDNTPSRPARISVHLHAYGEGRKLLLSRDITGVEQAETMRRDFVANVSHEIRTPLTVLMGFIETLQSLPLDEAERGRYLGLMGQQAQRMQSLVNDLLTLSRLEGSPPPGAGEWSSLSALGKHCEEEARALAGILAKPIQLEFNEPPPLELGGSPSELLSALTNLVSNAVRYTPAEGKVSTSWQLAGDGRLAFEVRDSGPGIAPEHIPRLTERFYRVDRSRSRETGGTGLGLAIVKHVLQRHGAELKIESAVGAGSTFTILFPASRLRAPAEASSAKPATGSPQG